MTGSIMDGTQTGRRRAGHNSELGSTFCRFSWLPRLLHRLQGAAAVGPGHRLPILRGSRDLAGETAHAGGPLLLQPVDAWRGLAHVCLEGRSAVPSGSEGALPLLVGRECRPGRVATVAGAAGIHGRWTQRSPDQLVGKPSGQDRPGPVLDERASTVTLLG